MSHQYFSKERIIFRILLKRCFILTIHYFIKVIRYIYHKLHVKKEI